MDRIRLSDTKTVVGGRQQETTQTPRFADDFVNVALVHVNKVMPKASSEAVRFLDDIDEEAIEDSLANDSLQIISNDTENRVGNWFTCIQLHPHDSSVAGSVTIRMECVSTVGGIVCGSSSTTRASLDSLELLEDRTRDFIEMDNGVVAHETEINRDGDSYVITRSTHNITETTALEYRLPVRTFPVLVTKGLCILLRKILVRRGVPDNFIVPVIDHCGTPCEMSIESLPERLEQIGDVVVDVLVLKQTMLSSHHEHLDWQFHYTKGGYLVSRRLLQAPFTMKLLSLPHHILAAIESDARPSRVVRKPVDWKSDLQLQSIYADKKEELCGSYVKYLSTNKIIHDILSDLMQHLLMNKPDDVIGYVFNYFSDVLPLDGTTD